MKLWCIIIGLIVIAFIIRELPITISYSYTGDRTVDVQKGLDTWLEAGIKFVPTSLTNSLIITHNKPEEFVLSQMAAGENIDNKIRISTRYPRSSSDIIGIVSHEAGHYLGLLHNTETNSVMNPDLPLSKRPSEMDIQRVKWQKLYLLPKTLKNTF